MCGRYYYGTGFEPKSQGLRAECYFMDELACMMPAKAKYKPPTFEEFCNRAKVYEDFRIDSTEQIYLVEYKDVVVGTLRSTITVSLDDLGMLKIDSKDIQEAIQEYKLQMYRRLTQEYDKKNKEATIEEEKNMFSKLRVNEGTPAPNHKNSWFEGIPAVEKVETYNQRVVKVTFIDDTFTKSVCSENDHFDIDVGITICLMKRLIGTNSDNATREYNRLMNNVHAVMEKNEKEKLAAQAQKAADKAKKRKIELKKAAKKLKAKEEQIDIQKQAIIRAHQEMEGMVQ